MLVLTRSDALGQNRIVFTLPDGQTLSLTIFEAKKRRVRIGIDAPKDVLVSRDELICDQNGNPHFDSIHV